MRVMIGCIEYAGVNPSAVRPGPPKAWSRCSSTSLEPLPAHTCSGVTGTPVVALQVGREVLAQRGELAVGVAVEAAGHLGHGRSTTASTTSAGTS